MITLGNTMRNLRKQKGLSGAELARKVGRSRSYISDIESDRYVPSDALTHTIAQLLGVPYSFLDSLKHTQNKL